MNKNISHLNIPEENKILLSKIERRVSFLSNKSEEYFDSVKTVRSKNIEEAYAVNEDLISILKQNNDLIMQLKDKSLSIRQEHQTDFTREVQLSVTEQVNQASIINSTIDQKDKLVTSDEKLYALSKRRAFIKNGTARRKSEMMLALNSLEKRISNENLLDIQPMKEDVELIKKFINPKEINKSRHIYYLILGIMIFVLIMLGGAIWIL